MGEIEGKAFRKERDPPPLHPAAELNRTNLYLKQGPGEVTFARIALLKPCFLPRSAGLVALSINWNLIAPLLTREKYLHQEIDSGLYPSELSHSNSAYEE